MGTIIPYAELVAAEVGRVVESDVRLVLTQRVTADLADLELLIARREAVEDALAAMTGAIVTTRKYRAKLLRRDPGIRLCRCGCGETIPTPADLRMLYASPTCRSRDGMRRARARPRGASATPLTGRTAISRDVSGRIGSMSEAHYVTRDELRAELAEMKVDLIKWMVGTGLGIAAITATLAGIILRALQ